jgi:hypothetical protein
MDYSRAFFLIKLADIMDTPASPEITSHFPFIQQQQNWKYKHSNGKLVLKNGEATHTFTFPESLYPEHEDENYSFPIQRVPEENYNSLEGKERVAQIHRSHPGEIYLTLHEGYRNPTYTLKHEEGDKWKAILKKKLNKKIKDLTTEVAAEKKAHITNPMTLSSQPQMMPSFSQPAIGGLNTALNTAGKPLGSGFGGSLNGGIQGGGFGGSLNGGIPGPGQSTPNPPMSSPMSLSSPMA